MSNVVKMVQPQEEKVVMIDGWVIKQDAKGLFCLNDLHKAAGGANKHKPSEWLRLDASKVFLEELRAGNPATNYLYIRKGRGVTGTYAVKELVYAYAMWISPEYHLKVIRAYDRLATEGVAVHEDAAVDLLANPLKYLEALLGQAKALQAERDAALAKIAEDTPKVSFYDDFAADDGDYKFREVAKMLGVKEADFREILVAEHVMYKLNRVWVPYKRHVDAGRFVNKVYTDRWGQEFTYANFTAKGIQFCAKLVQEHGLILKAA